MKQHKNIVVAQAPHAKSPQQRSPVAPPVYRPQPLPAVLQRKIANPSAHQPVQAQRVLQAKIAQTKWHIDQDVSSVLQLAEEKKWSFTLVRKFVAQNAPVAGERKDVYVARLIAMAVGIDAVNRRKLEEQAGKAHDLANPKAAEKKKKKDVPDEDDEWAKPGWTVDTGREVSKNYDFGSGGGAHKPKGRVWFGEPGVAWSVDKDEHAGAGYKKFTRVANKWRYAGSYNVNLVYKDR